MSSQKESISVGDTKDISPILNQTLVDFFEKSLELNPELLYHIAVKDADKDDTKLTFDELNKKSNRLARAFVDRFGNQVIGNGEIALVAVRFDPNVDLIVSLLAILKAGFSYLPIAPDWPVERIQYLLEDSKPLAIVTNKNDYINDITEVIPFESFETSSYEDGNLRKEEMNRETSTNTYAVMYTSGSTGLPKGVRLLNRSVLQRIHWQWRLLPYQSKDDICAFKASITFIDAVSEIFSSLLSGHTLIVFPTQLVKDVSKFVKALADNRVSRIYLIPSLIKNMLEVMKETNQMLPCLTHWESTGEALTYDIAKSFFHFFEDKKRKLCNIYGGTEMMDNIYEEYESMNEFEKKSLDGLPSLGKAVNNSIVYIMDEKLNPQKDGEIGEICITGYGIASEYIGRHKELSKTSFTPFKNLLRPEYGVIYRTGDYAKMVHGRIYYQGRRDAQVKVRGQRVNLSEIESAIQTKISTDNDAKIMDCKALVVGKNTHFQTIVAFYTFANEQSSCEDHQMEMKDKLKKILPPHMIPKLFYCSSFPTLVNGKIDRQALIKSYEENLVFEATYTDEELKFDGCTDPSLYEVARVVLNSICSILGVSKPKCKPRLSDNFFEIGGTSINAVAVVSKINECTAVSIESFIQAKTIGDLIFSKNEFQKSNLTPIESANDDIEIRQMQTSDKEIVLQNHVQTFIQQETLSLAMEIGFEEAMVFWSEAWKAVELCMNLSLVAVDKSGGYLGHCFGMDHHTSAMEKVMDDPKVREKFSRKMSDMLDFVIESETSVVFQHYPPEMHETGGVAFEILYLATNRNLKHAENLKVVRCLEQGMVDLATHLGYKAIICLNTSPVTQHIAINELGYVRLETIQVNKHVSSRTNQQAFPIKNDDIVVTVDAKYLE